MIESYVVFVPHVEPTSPLGTSSDVRGYDAIRVSAHDNVDAIEKACAKWVASAAFGAQPPEGVYLACAAASLSAYPVQRRINHEVGGVRSLPEDDKFGQIPSSLG